MSFDFNLFFGVTGFGFGAVATYIAIKEHVEKKALKKTIDSLKNEGFVDNIKKGLALLPIIKESEIESIAQQLSSKYLISYLNATSTNDQTNILNLWEKIAQDVGKAIESHLKRDNVTVPDGLAEYLAFSFLSAYSKDRAQDFLTNVVSKDTKLEVNFAKYYLSAKSDSKNITEIVDRFRNISNEQVELTLTDLKGKIPEMIAELFKNKKWHVRMIERLREFVNNRNLSYNSVVGKLLETNPMPKLYVIFKNERNEPESEDATSTGRIVHAKLQEMRTKGQITAISYMSSIYFGKDAKAVKTFLESLPEGTENNYIVFVGEVDPLTMTVKTSDKLDGKPQEMYQNLQSFREFKNIYEGIIVKLGVKPSEFIETADLGFLLEKKSAALSDSLRKQSESIKKELGEGIGKTITHLTDLRDLDVDEIGQFGSMLSEKCNLAQSSGRELAERIVKESHELYNSIYGRD